ncbi:MAG: GNAT family N-acetyltransferase [Caldimonas sp.]
MAIGLEIRAAGLDDVPGLLALYRLLEVGNEPELPLEAARAHFLDMVSNPRHQIHVALRGNELLGAYSMIFVRGLPHGARESCVIEDVVVASERQGRGIGKQMMRHAMAACAARHCYKLVLSSHLRREQAHRFYESLGFRKHGYSFLLDQSCSPAGSA